MAPSTPATSRLLPRLLALALPLLGGAEPEAAAWGRTVRVTIKNVKQNEYLFASYKKTRDGRLAMTWIPGFDARKDTSGQWDMTLGRLGRGHALVTIKNVRYPSFLYVGEQKRDHDRRWAYTGEFHPRRLPMSALWEMRSLRPGLVTLRSASYGEYFFAGVSRQDLQRRYALTWVPGFDASKDTTGQWRITRLGVVKHDSGSLDAGSVGNFSEGLDLSANNTEGLDFGDFLAEASDEGAGLVEEPSEPLPILP